MSLDSADLFRKFARDDLMACLAALDLAEHSHEIQEIHIEPSEITINWFDHETSSFIETRHLITGGATTSKPKTVKVPETLTDPNAPWSQNKPKNENYGAVKPG